MKKFIYTSFAVLLSLFFFTPPVFAQSADPGIIEYTNSTLQMITLISTAAAVFFLIKSGYIYITSTGNPSALEAAKKTIKNTLIGLVLVLSANVMVSVFNSALNPPTGSGGGDSVEVVAIEAVEPSEGLTQILIDAVSGFIQNIIESSTEPIVNGVIGYLTTTPTLLNNTVIRDFWLVSVGIVDVLFVVVVALLGLQFMSASSFGFEEVELRQLLPRIGLAFLGANVSLFLADYLIITSNALVQAMLDSTGGLNHAWVIDAINPATLITGTAPLIILIFLVLFLIVSIVLLLMYISRLIMIALGAVLAPFVFMMWALPKFSDFATIAIKTYFVNIFIVFVHVVIIQLAGAFLTLPDHTENSLISVAVAIGLFFTLLKTPSLMMQMVLYTTKSAALKKMSSQVVNVISTNNSSSITRTAANGVTKLPRKVIKG
jgi:hypothetical protein